MSEDLINEYKEVINELDRITHGTEEFMIKLAEKEKLESELKNVVGKNDHSLQRLCRELGKRQQHFRLSGGSYEPPCF